MVSRFAPSAIMKYNDNPTIEDAWWDEIDQFDCNAADFDTASCADLADELDLFRVQALADPNFDDTLYEWDCEIVEYSLWLPLEQCCHEQREKTRPLSRSFWYRIGRYHSKLKCWQTR